MPQNAAINQVLKKSAAAFSIRYATMRITDSKKQSEERAALFAVRVHAIVSICFHSKKSTTYILRVKSKSINYQLPSHISHYD